MRDRWVDEGMDGQTEGRAEYAQVAGVAGWKDGRTDGAPQGQC